MALNPIVPADVKWVIEEHINHAVDEILRHDKERLVNPIYQSMNKIRKDGDK